MKQNLPLITDNKNLMSTNAKFISLNEVKLLFKYGIDSSVINVSNKITLLS